MSIFRDGFLHVSFDTADSLVSGFMQASGRIPSGTFLLSDFVSCTRSPPAMRIARAVSPTGRPVARFPGFAAAVASDMLGTRQAPKDSTVPTEKKVSKFWAYIFAAGHIYMERSNPPIGVPP